VWRALTEPELVSKWLMSTDMRARVGQAFTFRSTPMPWWDGIVNCEITEIEPQKRLAYTWRSNPPASLDTVVTWTLAPTASGGTKLTLRHSGFTDGQAFDGAVQGWQRMGSKGLPDVLAGL
jgi:uncharacterized protein YndB with AHSA1/START domain